MIEAVGNIMIPEKIKALFIFIDYLNNNKTEYLEKYIPLCEELNNLDKQRASFKPNQNYKDKQLYDKIQIEIAEKFQPIEQGIYIPVLNKLKELKIWSGENVFTSIWNNNISAISDFKRDFAPDDVPQILEYKQKYLSFREETNSNFLCLQFVLSNLDEILKELFDFFKDTQENEFDGFETKTIKVSNLEEAINAFKDAKGNNIRFSFPDNYFFNRAEKAVTQSMPTNIFNKIIMGDNIKIGDISNNSGQIIIGKDIKISDSLNGKTETADKIKELINLIRKEQNINDEQRQSLITNFDKVKDEIFEPEPAKSKIFKWLSSTKGILDGLVLTHEVNEAVHWVYNNFNFIVQQIKS